MLEFAETAFGDLAEEFTDALYCLAKSKYTLGEKEAALQTVRRAIRIEAWRPLQGTKKDLNLAMMYLLKATILN